jgi:hypothetical protein
MVLEELNPHLLETYTKQEIEHLKNLCILDTNEKLELLQNTIE